MVKPSPICLTCPVSCSLRPQTSEMPGQKLCPRGEMFRLQEEKEPLRHYFSTVRLGDGLLYAYKTTEPVPLEAIEEFCRKLSEAVDSQARNKLHQFFCNRYQVKLTCIDQD